MDGGYLVITPAHNEAENLDRLAECLVAQTARPRRWVIVDDGSTDSTAAIGESRALQHHWISVVTGGVQRSRRAGGTKVVVAFNRGLVNVDVRDFDFLVKLDADLSFGPSYFESIGNAFRRNPNLGLCGGRLLVEDKLGVWVEETSSAHHVRGAVKAYRTNCFIDIGGIPNVHLWDGLDELLARYRGWDVVVLDLAVKHHRPTSTLINRGVRESFRAGRETYMIGYDLFLGLLRSISYARMTRPRVMSGAAFMAGCVWGAVKRQKRHVDDETAGFIRRFQYDRLSKRLKDSLHRRTTLFNRSLDRLD